MRKAFIFVLDGVAGGLERAKAWGNQEDAVIHWRTELPNCMFLISEQDAEQLAESFMRFNSRKGKFLICEATDNRQGLLTSDAWYLMRNKQRKPKNPD